MRRGDGSVAPDITNIFANLKRRGIHQAAGGAVAAGGINPLVDRLDLNGDGVFLPVPKKHGLNPIFEDFRTGSKTSQQVKFSEDLRRVRVCLSRHAQGFKECVQTFRVSGKRCFD